MSVANETFITINGQQVAMPRLAAIAGRTRGASATPTVQTGSAYTAGNVVGGLMTLAGLAGDLFSTFIQSARLNVAGAQTAGFDLHIFRDNPTASTFTDKAAPVIATADKDKWVTSISLSSPNSKLGSNVTLYDVQSIGRAISAVGPDLYAVLTTSGTPTFSGGSDVTVTVNTISDL